MGYESFEYLVVWQKARVLKNEIWELVKTFPSEEKYRLTDQIIRSTRSIGNQLAEGHGRWTFRDRLRFTIMSRGSVSETIGHLIDAKDVGYITDEIYLYYRGKITELEKVMNGYVKYLESKIK